MKNVMLDLETLGTRPGSILVSIGACEFGPRGVGRSFYQVCDLSTQGPLIIDPKAVAWWMQQSDFARSVFNDVDRKTLSEALFNFTNWWRAIEAQYIWGHGASFDPVLMQAAYFAMGLREPWDHRGIRDTRTIFAATNVSVQKSEKAHHALKDAQAQALAVIVADRLIPDSRIFE